MATEYVVKLRIVGANGLPRTDTFSKIDPFFELRVGNHTFKTSTKDDNENPRYDQGFYAPVYALPGVPGRMSGQLQLLLFDEDTVSNTHVGTATLDLATLNSGPALNLTLPIQFTKDKYTKQKVHSTVTISIEGAVQSYGSLRAMFAGVPGVFFNDHDKRLYIPIQESQGLVYVGIEHETDKVDVKVFVTRPNSGLMIDMAMTGRQHTKVRRRTYHQGHALVPGLIAYEEVKLDDVPITISFEQVIIIVHTATAVGEMSAETITTRHGWKGALGFQQACKVLHGIDVDTHEQEIYMTADPQETMMVVDWDKNDVDMKLVVLATPQTAGKAYDFIIKDKDIKKTSEIFAPPKVKLGKYMVQRIYELDDVPYGVAFSDMKIVTYAVSNPRMYTVQSIARLSAW